MSELTKAAIHEIESAAEDDTLVVARVEGKRASVTFVASKRPLDLLRIALELCDQARERLEEDDNAPPGSCLTWSVAYDAVTTLRQAFPEDDDDE